MTGLVPVDDLEPRIQGAQIAQDNATRSLDDLILSASTAGKHRWLASADEQNVMLMLWYVEILGVYLQQIYAATLSEDRHFIHEDIANQLPDWLDNIDLWQLAVTRGLANLELRASTQSVDALGMPELPVTELTATAVWFAWSDVRTRVVERWAPLRDLPVPVRLRPLLDTIRRGLLPAIRETEVLEQEWMLTGDDAGKRRAQLADRYQTAMREVFAASLLMFAPIRDGSYSSLLRRKLTLSELSEELQFDPWCLTDPQVISSHRGNPESEQALAKLWEANPNPSKTFSLAQEVKVAHEQGKIRRIYGNAYPTCPWVSKWLVHSEVVIGGVTLSVGWMFAINVATTSEGFVSKVAKAGRLVAIRDLLGQ